MLETVKTYQSCNNYHKTSDAMANCSENDDVLIESRQIKSFLSIFKEAYYKLTAFTGIKKQILSLRIQDPIDVLLTFIDAYITYRKTNNHTSNMLRQSLDTMPPVEILTIDFFYDFQQSMELCGRLFLFGTPTQKRSRLSRSGFA